ncbi:hypothetical protein M3Y94_00064400 [Aphelenchoides besseyi]|nr:hypothetical protein M3Y94_00064400 [Aphelenchoides besseyi]
MPKRVKNATICGHFTEDYQNDRVIFDEQCVRKLNTEFMARKEIAVDLLGGYQKSMKFEPFANKLKGLTEYLAVQMCEQEKTLNEITDNANVVCLQSLFYHVASSLYYKNQAKDFGFSIVARQHKGIVFLNEYEAGESKRLPSGSEKRGNAKAYVWSKLEQILTLADGDKWPDYKGPANFNHQLKVVSRCDLIDEDSPGVHRLLLAGNASGKDQEGNYVRILPFRSKSTPKSAKLLAACHTWPQYQIKDYIESILCGIKDVVAGVYTEKENQFTLRQVLTMESVLFLSEAKDWNINDCLDYVFQFINRVRVTLKAVPEGTIIHIVRPPKSLDYKLNLVKEDEHEEMNMLSKDFLDVVQHIDLMSG